MSRNDKGTSLINTHMEKYNPYYLLMRFTNW